MRIKNGYIMKKLDRGYVVVTVGQASREFNGLIRLNETGAFIWQSILDGMDSRKKLVRALMNRYEDLEESVAEKDLNDFLESVDIALEE